MSLTSNTAAPPSRASLRGVLDEILPSFNDEAVRAWQDSDGKKRFSPSSSSPAAPTSFTRQPPSDEQVLSERLQHITDPSTRKKILAAFLYAWHDKLKIDRYTVPLELYDAVKPSSSDLDWLQWEAAIRAITSVRCPCPPWWPALCTAGKHQWSADKVSGNCQVCGAVNNQARIFVTFVVNHDEQGDEGIERSDQWMFSCLQGEWNTFFEQCSGAELENLPYDDAREENFHWEYIQKLRFPEDGEDVISFDPHYIHELEVVKNAAEAELLLRTLHVPRVSPGFLKFMIKAPCEPGSRGRCFCDGFHKCTVGRNKDAGKNLESEEEEEEEEEEEKEEVVIQEKRKHQSKKRKRKAN